MMNHRTTHHDFDTDATKTMKGLENENGVMRYNYVEPDAYVPHNGAGL